MGFLSLQEQPLALLIAIYVAAAAIVWSAGTRASRYADTISRRTGIGGAVIGMVMLGSMTSLPEIGTSVTAAVSGEAGLAVSNLLGGVAFQVVVLAVVDAFIGRKALTATIFNPSILLQGVVCVLLLALAVAGTVAGDASIFGIGAWSYGILFGYIVAVFFVRGQERDAAWLPRVDKKSLEDANGDGGEQRQERGSVGWALISKTAIAAALILAAGVVLTWTAEAIAGQTGLNLNIAGLTLLAVATSLPELSTAISAVRIGRNDLAIGDVLGGNMFDLMLIFVVDAIYLGPPVLGQVGGIASFAGLLGIIITAIYLIGMIERRNRSIFRMGYDSLLVMLFYAAGITYIFSVAIEAAA